jgi:hypothetical protein
MSLSPEHASLVELTKQLRALGVTSFTASGVSVQMAAQPIAAPAKVSHITQRSHRAPKLAEDEQRARVEAQRAEELSRV